MTEVRNAVVMMVVCLSMGCGHDVPSHDVEIVSDCNGPVRSARFHFDAFDYEANCTGGFLGPCSRKNPIGERVSGDLEVSHLDLIGHEGSGPEAYALHLPPRADASAGSQSSITCLWFVDEDRQPTEGKRQNCGDACWAELEVLRPGRADSGTDHR